MYKAHDISNSSMKKEVCLTIMLNENILFERGKEYI